MKEAPDALDKGLSEPQVGLNTVEKRKILSLLGFEFLPSSR
jgi:hypothetical protein